MADQLDLFLVVVQRIVGCLGRPITTKQQSMGWFQPITVYVAWLSWLRRSRALDFRPSSHGFDSRPGRNHGR